MTKEIPILDSLKALFSSFPAIDRGDMEWAVRSYMMAVEDVPPQFVAKAVKRFIRGEVERPRNGFLPATDELAREARKIAGIIPVDEKAKALIDRLPEDQLLGYVKAYREKRFVWNTAVFGPTPDNPNTLVPQHILQKAMGLARQ